MRLIRIQVHRFRGAVAVNVHGDEHGATAYLSPKDTRKLIRALQRTALDIEKRLNFSDSICGTFELSSFDGRDDD